MKDKLQEFEILTLSSDDDSIRWILTHPTLEDLELSPIDIFIFDQLKLGKSKIEIDESVMGLYGAVSNPARNRVNQYIEKTNGNQKKVNSPGRSFSKKWRVLKSYELFYSLHLLAIVLWFLSPNFISLIKEVASEHKFIGLLSSIVCVCLLSWLPWFIQSMVYGSLSSDKAYVKFNLSNLYPDFRFVFDKENRLSRDEKTQLSLVPLSVIAIMYSIGSIVMLLSDSLRVYGMLLVLHVQFRWLLGFMLFKKPLILNTLSISFKQKNILKSWHFIYNYLLPMSWEKRSPLNRDQEIQIFISNLYMIFNLVVCVCLGTAMFENRNSLTTEIDRTVQLILLLTYLIIILVLVSVVVKLILQFFKTTHYWFTYSFKEKSSNIFFTLNFCSLVFISVQLIFPNYIQLLLLIFLSISLFIFHMYISQKGMKYRVTNLENLILMCNIVFLILCLLSSRSEFLLLSGLGFTYFFIRNPNQLLIVFSKDSEFKYCALAFTVSGLFGLISIALYFVGFSLFVMPCIALANISQSAAYILRIKHNLNFDITSLIFNRDKLKKRLSDEEYLVDACKIVSQILNKLFGESYANSLIKYSFHLNKKTKMNELKTKDLSVYFGQLNQLKPSESKANKKLVKKLSPWLYSLKSDELLNYPVTTVPWKKRSLLRYVMEGQLEPIEKKIKRLRIITYLKSHFLFTYFDEVQIKKVSNYIDAQFYKPNETVFSEGDLGKKLYLIVDGVFEVFKRETSGDENIMIELSKKDFIGEQSLLKHKFQNTSIRAKTDGLMLSLDARVFSSLIKKDLSMLRKYMKVIDDLWFIKSNELFRNYTNESLSPIVNAFKHKSFKMGRYVFKEGDVGDEFYIIRNGEVGVYLKRKSTPLALLSIGEFFGEIALLKNTPRTASIKTITETETLSLSRESLNRIMSDDLNLQSSLEFLSDQRLSKQN